ASARRPRTLRDALATLPGANLALISVPGPYAALEAHKALSAGLHVLLFSDNVPVVAEVELKARAAQLGLFVMGPGAGTAMIGGIGLGFANVVMPGRVGIAAAAGTGAQELMCLLDSWGAGVSHVLGLGGRDLSAAVGGRTTTLALDTLEADGGTEVVVLVSKPPAPDVARALLDRPRGKPVVAALLGLDQRLGRAGSSDSAGVRICSTLESAAAAAVGLLGLPRPRPERGLGARATATMARLDSKRRTVRGLFSGGTLCHEAMLLLCQRLGPVHSNVPLRPEWALPAPPGAHVCLDLGEEEFTRGRPHPMIDPESRIDLLREAARDPATAVILVDLVLGYGSHPDPASVLAPACREICERLGSPAVVAYVLGTHRDPQNYSAQREQLERAGCVVAPTAARAALLAGAVAARRPEMAEEEAA
ncbi:MAG: protein FdrA, partial [Candidatus Dormibacteraeota bacterium]|nr:protein FdrA [Candidatus Dormibacteraeota bacterium]